jgi:hypothetical protein
MVDQWPVASLEQKMPAFVDAIRHGLRDADAEVRALSRKVGAYTLTLIHLHI